MMTERDDREWNEGLRRTERRERRLERRKAIEETAYQVRLAAAVAKQAREDAERVRLAAGLERVGPTEAVAIYLGRAGSGTTEQIRAGIGFALSKADVRRALKDLGAVSVRMQTGWPQVTPWTPGTYCEVRRG